MKKVTINIIFAILMMMVWQVTSAFAGATLTVNDSSTGNTCNNSLSLYEAARIAESSVTPRFSGRLTAGEKAQVTGAVFIPVLDPPDEGCPGAIWEMVSGGGRLYADDIKFTNDVGTINGGIILGKNDDIDGLKPNGQKVILNGSGISGNINGIELLDTDPTGSQVRNLVIQNFPANGILAAHLNGAIFEGLDIHGNGGNGLVITYPIVANANSRNVTVGGDQPQHRNLIYGNTLNGIEINALSNSDHNGSQNIVVKNNYIGTSDGTTDNGNNGNGIVLYQAFGVTIGDTTGATRNIISGNNTDGIQIKGLTATGNTIIANFIGTDSSSGARLGNGANGISLIEGAGGNAITGGIPVNRIGLPGLGNVISANNNFGIFLDDTDTSDNRIQANYIGTNIGGTTDLGNISDGILLGFGTYDNQIGGTGTGEGNLIAFNRNGVLADGGFRNFIKRNRMFSNDNLGIDLTPPSGVNPNDAGDGDTGPNALQNYPMITYVNAQSNSVTIQGTFNSTASRTYTLEFFGNTAVDTTGFGEGRNYIGSTTVTTDTNGNATFNVPFSVSIATVGTWITATATDSADNTSEFSQARNICADLALSPSALFASNTGVTSNFTVVTSAGCTYTAQSNASWITLGSTSNGTVNFTVAPNAGVQRSSSILVSYNNGTLFTSRSFNITQVGGCTYSLSPTSRNVAATASNSSFNVVASDASCTWTATSNAAWLTVTSGSSGTGSGTVSFSVAANSGSARSGTITAAGQTFTVNQSGVGCTYSLSPTNQSVTAAGTSLSFSLITTAGCTWTAVSNAAWITVIGGANGTGNGTISYTVAANTGPARSGTITAGGQLFTINQASGCSFTLNPTSQSFSTAGGNGSFNVIASNGACTWTATESATWITITGGGSGTGNGTVSFSVDATAGLSRSAFIVVGGQSFTVSQANGCTFSISPISLNIAAAGGNSSFNVTTSDGSCGWTALSNSSWITGVAGGFQFGNQTITFAVAANTTAARIGTITVAGQTFTVNQASGCVYSISPSGQSFPGIGGTGSFDVTTTAGCSWSASTGATWVTITSGSSGSGNGTINYTVAPNPGNARAASIIGPFFGGFVGISQASQCTYVTNPTSATFPANGGSGSFTVTNATGCNWQANRGSNSWITITSSPNNSGNQTVTYTVAPNTGAARNGNIGIFENITASPNRTFTITQAGKQTKFDFDGDGKTDIGIFRPTGGEWWYLRSSDGQNRAFPFGLATDKLVPADFTGDGKNDVAFWRPSTGFWYVMRSEDNTFYAFPFGANGDIPAPGDYDGDGIADVAVFRPSTATWYINKSSGGTTIQQFGAIGDLPNVADYDGDGKTDIGIFRPNGTNGAEWWILRSSNGSVFATQFGNSTDKAVPADFTGDGKADVAFWRPASGFWYVLRSEDFSYYAAPFGALGDVPTVGDYDGDGKSDFAVFRPSNNTWFIQRSTAGTLIQGFGNAGDVPIPSVFTP